MRTVLAELAEIADMVVVDTPPLLVVADAIPLLDDVSGVILIGRIDETTHDALARTRQVITDAGGTVVGVVATGARTKGLYGYDLYGYGEEGDFGPTPEAAISGNGSGGLGRLIRRPGKRMGTPS
jgi:Mrp family chromosome partitioning ATPase